MVLAIEKPRAHGVGLVGAGKGDFILTPLVQMAVDAAMLGIALPRTGVPLRASDEYLEQG